MMIGTAMAARPASRMAYMNDIDISFRARSGSKRQIPAQYFVNRLPGIREHVMAIVLFGAVAQSLAKRVHFPQVAFANFSRARQDFRNLLQTMKLHEAHERKLELVRIHGMKNN